MHRIDSSGTAAIIPVPGAVGSQVGYFTEGNPGLGVEPAVVSADWLNAVQEELAAVIEGAGLVLDKTSRTQLKQALTALAGGAGSGLLTKAFANTGYTVTAAAPVVGWNTVGGNCVQNLPAAAGVAGQIFTIYKSSVDANTVTITPNGAEKINGDSTLVLDTQYSSVRVMSISTGYILV
jgi:hypothetical protein